MALLFFSSPSWQLILQADLMTKLILIGLFLTSIGCITLIVAQLIYLFLVKRASAEYINRIKAASSLTELMKVVQNADAYEALVIKKVLQEKDKLVRSQELKEHDVELLYTKGEHEVDDLVGQLERFLPVLGVSGAVSPLIGLFGTVWGLIHAFISISHEKSADIAVVAPGIAEALFTTLAGLLVAIPALIFFHYCAGQIKKIDWQLRQVLELTILLIKKEA